MSVVDASVAVKWFVTEPCHLEAMALLGSGAALFAPDLILIEVANVLRRKYKGGELTEVQWREAVGILPRYFDRLIPSADLISTAVEIALKLDLLFTIACMWRSLQRADKLWFQQTRFSSTNVSAADSPIGSLRSMCGIENVR